MKRLCLWIIFLIPGFTLPGQSIKDLEFLIGTWNTSELIFEGTPREYVESGVRECAYYLDSTYIKCETRAFSKGRNRVYSFFFNYDEKSHKFQVLKIFSDYSFYSKKSWNIDSTQRLITEKDTGGDQYIGHIDFQDDNRIIWRGWRPVLGKEPRLELLFTEEAIRQ